MTEWRQTTWGELATLKYGKALRDYRNSSGSTRVFGTNGPIGFISSEPHSPGPGVIVGRKGAYRGIHFSDGPFSVIDTAFWLEPVENLDFRWAYYELLTHDINSMDSGSAIPSTSRDAFYKMPVFVPPIDEQRAIATTLGALDDKIESNRRAVGTIQQVAQAIFRQWKSGAGAAEVSTFGNYADVYGGATPKTAIAEYWGGTLDWATPTDVTGLNAPYLFETSRKITDQGLQSSTAVMHPVGTIFMTSRATIGSFAINQVPAATNQGFIAVRPREDSDRFFLFEEMRARVDEFLDNANGSTFLEISRGRFKELPLEVPAKEEINRLNDLLRPLHSKAAQLAAESDSLVDLRDALLPELLSGRLVASQDLSK